MNGGLEFDWDVSTGGYRWIEATTPSAPAEGPELALVPVNPLRTSDDDAAARSPEPEPALFRLLAEVEPNTESILAFANHYGDLGADIELCPARRDPAFSNSPTHGTFLVTWRHQIAYMLRLVSLWDLLQQEDREGLAPYIQWRKLGAKGLAVIFDSHPRTAEAAGMSLGFDKARALIASSKESPELLKTFDTNDPLLPGWVYLQREIETGLHHTASEIPALMEWEPERNRPTLRWAAPTLLSAVWLQFADAVSNDRTFNRCRECDKWFEVAPDAARTHRRFCSNRCRSKAYRDRQNLARQMYFHEKKSFEAIAEELDSQQDTVRRWIMGD